MAFLFISWIFFAYLVTSTPVGEGQEWTAFRHSFSLENKAKRTNQEQKQFSVTVLWRNWSSSCMIFGVGGGGGVGEVEPSTFLISLSHCKATAHKGKSPHRKRTWELVIIHELNKKNSRISSFFVVMSTSVLIFDNKLDASSGLTDRRKPKREERSGWYSSSLVNCESWRIPKNQKAGLLKLSCSHCKKF